MIYEHFFVKYEKLEKLFCEVVVANRLLSPSEKASFVCSIGMHSINVKQRGVKHLGVHDSYM